MQGHLGLLKMVYACASNWIFGGYWNMVFMIIFWIAVIAIVIWLIKEQNFSNIFNNKNALEIVKERYAKGEINKQKFEQMKKELNK